MPLGSFGIFNFFFMLGSNYSKQRIEVEQWPLWIYLPTMRDKSQKWRAMGRGQSITTTSETNGRLFQTTFQSRSFENSERILIFNYSNCSSNHGKGIRRIGIQAKVHGQEKGCTFLHFLNALTSFFPMHFKHCDLFFWSFWVCTRTLETKETATRASEEKKRREKENQKNKKVSLLHRAVSSCWHGRMKMK